MDNPADLEAAVERLKSGAPVETIDPYLVERMWDALSRIRRDEGLQATAGMVGARLDPGPAPATPGQMLAMTVRYALLTALVESGVLDEYMTDETLRKKVFAAAALLPCDQNDLYEAVTERTLRQSPPDIRHKRVEELKQAGYDPDHAKMAHKFIEWIRDNC